MTEAFDCLQRVFVDEQLLVSLTGLELLSSYEHLDFHHHVFFRAVAGTDPQVVVAMLLVQGVLHVVIISPMDFEELVVIRIIGKLRGLLQFFCEHLARNYGLSWAVCSRRSSRCCSWRIGSC